MKFHHQEFEHDPENGIIGDCYRTAVACILDKEKHEIPNFNEGYSGDDLYTDVISKYYAELGVRTIRFFADYALPDVLKFMATANPDVLYLITGVNHNGKRYSLIALNDTIVHDPNKFKVGLSGPLCDNGYLIEIFLLPLKTAPAL